MLTGLLLFVAGLGFGWLYGTWNTTPAFDRVDVFFEGWRSGFRAATQIDDIAELESETEAAERLINETRGQ